MTSYIQFYDIVGANASKVPLIRNTLVAYYNTGTGIVPETQAQIAAAKTAGMGVILIDQQPGNPMWSQGLSDVADYESGAMTETDVINGVKARQAHGWQSTIYVSYNSLGALDSALRNAGCNMSLVFYGVADYSWSISQAQQLLAQNPQWAYIQFGDNVSNANTLVPGTNMTCGQAVCDIDVANATWGNQFMPTPPPLPPYPAPTNLTATEYRLVQFDFTPTPGVATYAYEILDASGNTVITYQDVTPSSVAGGKLGFNVYLPVGGPYTMNIQAHVSPTNNWSSFTSVTVTAN